MFKHLKKYNETLFLMVVFLLFSGSVLFFNHHMSSRILLLKSELSKFDQQYSIIFKQNDELIASKLKINRQIEEYQKLKNNIQEQKIDVIAKEVANNPKNSEILAILPPSETINIQQNEMLKKLSEDITEFKNNLGKTNSIFLKINSESENDKEFNLGNLPDGSLKNTVRNEVNNQFKKQQEIFSKINPSSETYLEVFLSLNLDSLNVEQKTSLNTIHKSFDDRITSITKEINIIQITSAVGIASLFFVLIIIIFGKLIKTDEDIDMITQENFNILKSVKEGLFLISPNMIVGTQISQSTAKILEREIHEHDDFDLVLQELVDEKTYIQAVDYIKVLLTGNVKESLVQSLNPLNEIKVKSEDKEKYLSMYFNRIKKHGEIVSLLVTIQDITKQVIISRELKESKNLARREIEAILSTISQNKANLLVFLEHMHNTINQINNTLQNIHDGIDYRKELNHIYRLVHKIKGEASTFGFSFFYESCHQFEELLNNLLRNENINGDIMLTVAVNLESLIQKTNIIKKIIDKSDFIDNNSSNQSIALSSTEQKVVNNIPVEEKETTFMENIFFLISQMNQTLGKEISLDFDMDLLDSLSLSNKEKIQDIIIQLVRNAGVHAFDKEGLISLSLKENNGLFILSCKDNGKGINVEQIKAKIKEKYNVDDSAFDGRSEQQILSFIFKPGFSTSNEENMFGGRGVGLDLVAQIVKELSAKISLSTKINQGTEFTIQFPKE